MNHPPPQQPHPSQPTPSPPAGPVPGRPRLELNVSSTYELYAGHDGRGTPGEHEVHVILEVRAEGLGTVPRRPAEHCEVVVIDCSGSMAHPTLDKIAAARRAAAEAVGMLPDGTHFALVEGTDTARVAYPWGDPSTPATVAASPATRAEGSRTARVLDAHGGTRISAWLDLARRLLTARPETAFRHALLLTDGRDEHGRAEELRRVLDDCAGEFGCDVLGIGDDWDAAQLRMIADRLHGRAEAVVTGGAGAAGETGAQLTRLFRELVGAATRRTLPRLAVGVHVGPFLTVTLFRQVNPTVADLTDTAVQDGDRLRFGTGAWGDETRWYELRLRVDPGHAGPGPGSGSDGQPGAGEPGAGTGAVRIASLWLETEGEAAGAVELPGEVPVAVRWTDEPPPLTDPGGAGWHFLRHAELGEASRAGSAALVRGDVATAERELGRAVRLADELGDTEQLARLGALVVVENAATGQVRIRDTVEPGNIQAVIAGSTHTTTPPPVPPPAGSPSAGRRSAGSPSAGRRPADGRPVTCPRCAEVVQPGRYCVSCGHPLRKEE
ncbi:VWA domain-containing protein [Streptomyces carminius]|uniref:VWA domain-containing protein n=1 Tax=Streptomyces carminius TaxID=2665496 RepID=A0A2M8LV08_9ACTN|nr:vWA domain-containing protein [Streptomyces carminius]PJE95759.1 VWA domain-containing protein [Streptomyces carminius]